MFDESFIAPWADVDVLRILLADKGGLRVHEIFGDIIESSWADGEDSRVPALHGEVPKFPVEELDIFRLPCIQVESSRFPGEERQGPPPSWEDTKGLELT